MTLSVEVANETERKMLIEVLAEARSRKWAGRIEVQMRPGWEPEIFGVHRTIVKEARPLRDDDSRAARQQTRETAGRT